LPLVKRRQRPHPGDPYFSPRGIWWSVLERSTHKGLADIPQERSGAQAGPAWAHPEEGSMERQWHHPRTHRGQPMSRGAPPITNTCYGVEK
jgi:hypothetical protein